MKSHHEVGHFKIRLMIMLLSLVTVSVMAGESFAATTCSSCHGMPPFDSAVRNTVSGAFKGNHQTHLGATATAAECSKCHANANYNSSHAATSGYKINMAANINSSITPATYSKGVLFNQTSVPVMGNCSNVNCHFEKNTSNRTPAPVWASSPASTDCNYCHTTPRGASGSHSKHEAKYGGTGSCVQCHPNYGTTNFNHATSAGKHKIVTSAFLTYSGGTPTSWLPTQATAFGSCRATACHDTGRNNPRTAVWGATGIPACSACHEASPTTFSHQKHLTGLNATKFTSNPSYLPVNCTKCHKGYVEGTTDTADHINGYVDVYYTTKGDLGPLYSATRGKGLAPSTCTTSYCHSNGAAGYNSATWGGLSTGCDFCHPLANLSPGHSAHIGSLLTEINFYNFTSNKSLGTAYKFGCGSCHPNNVSKHLDGNIDVDLAPAAAGGSLKAKNLLGATITAINGSGRCSNVYCHSNGYTAGTFKCVTTLAWTDKFINYTAASKGSKDRCAWCHGNSPNNGTIVGSSAHSAHVVGIHYDDIFNGVSKKLPLSGPASVNAAHGKDSRSTTINCNICHAATMTTSANDRNTACVGCHNGPAVRKNPANLISDSSKHVNGIVDVKFINQKLTTKAQLAASAFAGYTGASTGGWSRHSNGMLFKTYTSSYDVTKTTLFASAANYVSANGCQNVACHPTSTPVKWNDTVTCTSCHTRLK